MSRKRSTFVQFIDKNEELAEQYEKTIGEDLWSLPIQEIENLTAALASKLKIGFNSMLNNCINASIQNETPLLKTLTKLSQSESGALANDSLLQKYFSEIKKIYEKNNNNYDIPFCEENREKIISMNLKSVIAIAKYYQGLGIPLEDLISIGNEGLCKAFDKYDPKRACLKDDIIAAINGLPTDIISHKELCEIMSNYLTYGETIRQAFDKKFSKEGNYNKEDVLKWVDKNIHNAKFNSVACKWIKAYIVQEINNNSRIIKKPKTEIDKDKLKTGSYKREIIMNLDSPIAGDDNAKTLSDTLMADDVIEIDSIENEENYKAFKKCLNILLNGVKSRDRRIILKKFGIGTVRPLQANEISAQENLSVARISQIINATIEIMIENSKKYKDRIDVNTVFSALKSLV